MEDIYTVTLITKAKHSYVSSVLQDNKTTMDHTTETQDLYPIVQDLTDAEYGNCCCCDATLGSFSLEDLATPITSPRSLTPTPPTTPKSLPLEPKKAHRRGHSLFGLNMTSPRGPSMHHRSHSSPGIPPESCPSEDTNTISTEAEERVTEGSKFDDTYVLTRQVSNPRVKLCTFSYYD